MTFLTLRFNISTVRVLPFCFAIPFAFFALRKSFKRRNKRLPPGPPGIPLLGNLLQIKNDAWRTTFSEWKNIYGDLVYFRLGGTGVLILNSYETTADLLDRRAAIYSDRPRWIVAGDMLCSGLFLVIMKYGDLWRRMRRASNGRLNAGIATSYFPLQTQSATVLVKDLLRAPNLWESIIRRCTTSVTLKFTYGSQNVHESDVVKVANFISRVILATTPGAYLVEFFPWLKNVPRLMAPWKRRAEAWSAESEALFGRLYQGLKANLDEDGIVLDQHERSILSEHQLSWVFASICVAGTDTTIASLMWFMLAMVRYPDIQKKAQEELDAIVGRGRLPTFKDQGELVYIECIIREVLRWRPMLPLGLPHVAAEDDMYRGYFIPKGTICLPNVWTLNHDVDVFGSDVNEFNPDRHLTDEGRLIIPEKCPDGHVTFGFGKRICPGRHVSKNTLFINMAYILWTTTISPQRDSKNRPIMPNPDESLIEGFAVRPSKFQCEITYRFPEAEPILEGTLETM